MTSLNSHFYAGDEKDTHSLGVEKKILIEGHSVMIGDGNHVKTFIGSF
jgi:hypothetical protein